MEPFKNNRHRSLKLKRIGIDTHQEAVVYMRADCPICRSEGFQAQARVLIKTPRQKIIATLNVVYDHILGTDEAGLSEAAWTRLQPTEGEMAEFSHPPTVESLSELRAKVYGHRLGAQAFKNIIRDIVTGQYADVHLASFITACSGNALSLDEIIYLTEAMVEVGDQLHWKNEIIVDKHCVGGLPGNRTTPIVVAIVAAAGLTMPKTSSRAITSPAGTADTMETLTPVALSLAEMRRVVELEGACLVWGGAANLSPADDILIRVERSLDLDSEAQLIASVLSKKKAAGATHVVLDIPVGLTAKVRSQQDAQRLASLFEQAGQKMGLKIKCLLSDGNQPVGSGMGPALEARDVLAVLRGEAHAPQDLRERAIVLAGNVLELSAKVSSGQGIARAEQLLKSGEAWKKFYRICEAQGGFHEPGQARFSKTVSASHSGYVRNIDNRKLARVAKLAGAPNDKTAGLLLHAHLDDFVGCGEDLFTIHAESEGELHYAMDYVKRHPNILTLGE